LKRTRIKICGITRVADAEHVVAAGADAIGLVFYEASPRNVDLQQAKLIARSIPGFVTVVGLFVDPTADFVRRVCEEVPLELLQFHGNEDNDFCRSFGRRFIKAIRVKPDVSLEETVAGYPDASGILLDTYVSGTPGGTGLAFDWSLIPADLQAPLILAGGLNRDNVAQAVGQVRPYAVDVSGGVEASKGIKDPSKIFDFVSEVRRGDSI